MVTSHFSANEECSSSGVNTSSHNESDNQPLAKRQKPRSITKLKKKSTPKKFFNTSLS